MLTDTPAEVCKKMCQGLAGQLAQAMQQRIEPWLTKNGPWATLSAGMTPADAAAIQAIITAARSIVAEVRDGTPTGPIT